MFVISAPATAAEISVTSSEVISTSIRVKPRSERARLRARSPNPLSTGKGSTRPADCLREAPAGHRTFVPGWKSVAGTVGGLTARCMVGFPPAAAWPAPVRFARWFERPLPPRALWKWSAGAVQALAATDATGQLDDADGGAGAGDPDRPAQNQIRPRRGRLRSARGK